jgi:uncharacterized protein YndB with AHSA1/START domain
MRAGLQLEFERTIELPPTIVWDALIDPDLVAGWLADAAIDPRIGGRYDLTWQGAGTAETGVITELSNARAMRIETSGHGILSFRLAAVPGGSRGTSTLVRLLVDVAVELPFRAALLADWEIRLDQLDALLRGHPVDWEHWMRDYGDDWNAYFDDFKRAHGPQPLPPQRGTSRRQLR